MPPPHISFEQRKGLALRLMALPLLQQHEPRLLQAGAASELQILRDQIGFLAAKATESLAGERLDSKLESMAGELRARVRSELAGRFGPLLSPLVMQLTTEMTQVSCSTCSCVANAVCNGGENDDTLVAGGGHCIRLLRQLFDVALAIAQNAFRHYLPAVPLPTVEFSTAHYNGKPHDIPVAFYCGGKTMFDSGGNSVVQLHVTPAALDWETCLAALYVLLHECFCHAFYSARNPGQRTETGNDDPFTEGWMDWLVQELLSENLHLISGLPASGSEFARVATIFTDKRSQLRAQGSQLVSIHAKPCALGKAAAQNMLALLERLPESRSDARGALLRLSCDVLAEGFSLEKHEALVYNVNLGLPSPGEMENPQQFDKIPRYVLKYLRINNLHGLIGSISRRQQFI